MFTHARCHTSRSSLALARMQNDTLPDLLLHLRTRRVTLAARRSSLALVHMQGVSLPDLVLHLPVCRVLRWQVLSYTDRHDMLMLAVLLLNLHPCKVLH